MRRLLFAALLAPLTLPASAAHAGFFPAEVIDGPSPDILSVGDVDLSRDGAGGVVYVKREAGVARAFFSALSDGAFQPAQRVDPGLGAPSSQPVLAASSNGRLAVAFVAGDTLWTAVKGKDAPGFSAPAAVATGGVSNPSIDMSVNGATYLSYTQFGDVRVARAERDSPAFAVLASPVDVDQQRAAGEGARNRSRIAVSADGTALVVWGEAAGDGRTHVYARRLFELRVSAAPQDLTLNEIDGIPGGDADTPELDIEDDSSYAQVTFRQVAGATQRVVMRRLVGSLFDPPIALDSGSYASRGQVALTGRGEGLYGVSGVGGAVVGGTLFNNRISGTARLDSGNAIDPSAVAAIGENEDGVVAWLNGSSAADATVRARFFDGVEALKVEPETVISRPEYGPVDTGRGLDAAASRAGDVAVVFTQTGPEGPRLVAGIYDKPPTRVAGSNTTKVRKLTRLSWGSSLNLFGAVTYRVVLDGRQIAETQENQFVPQPGQIPDGIHTWQLFIRDRRGQEVVSRTRQLRVDNTPPTLTVSLKRKKRVVTLTARAGDRNGKQPSGLSRVLVDWGDGKLERMGTKATKRYPSVGTKKIRVKALDKAGNEAVVERSLRIG